MENTAASRWHKIRKGQGKVSEANKKQLSCMVIG